MSTRALWVTCTGEHRAWTSDREKRGNIKQIYIVNQFVLNGREHKLSARIKRRAETKTEKNVC